MSEFWFVEDIAPGMKIQTILHDMILKVESKFQKIEVLDSYFGKTLVTDGKTQSSAFDEFAYHESLVHPTMLINTLGNGGVPPKSVLIGGGFPKPPPCPPSDQPLNLLAVQHRRYV